MRQFRLVVIAGVGVLVLCVVAVAASLGDYTSHPEVANAHVAPVVGTPEGGPGGTPSPVPTMPSSIDSPLPQPQPTSDRTQPVRPGASPLTFDQLLQLLQQRHHRPSPPGR